MSNQPSIALIVLAAGASNRLGVPKQLLEWQGKPLLQHALDSVGDLPFNLKLLVLGAYAEDVGKTINANNFQVAINVNWEEGMGSSIRLGLEQSLSLNPNVDGLLFMVSDQPYIANEILWQIIDSFDSGSDIVVCRYGETIGVPALIGKDYFDELMQLRGDRGAKSIFNKYLNKVKTVDFESGSIDVDTPEDVEKLMQENGHND